MNSKIESQLSSLASGSASKIGVLGDALKAIGPVGLGIAGALGVAAGAFVFLTDKVEKFAELAKNLKDAAETTGLTVDQFQALRIAGEKVGLGFEQTRTFIEKLTTSIQQLKTNGSGPLYDALRNINPQLTEQVAGAKDAAAAIDIISRAYANLTNQFQRNELARAVGGRGGVAGGQLFGAVAGAGGLAGLSNDAKTAGDAVNKELNERIIKLKNEIDDIRRRTDDLWGEAFGVVILEAQKKSAEYIERIAKGVKDLKDQQAASGKTPISLLDLFTGGGVPNTSPAAAKGLFGLPVAGGGAPVTSVERGVDLAAPVADNVRSLAEQKALLVDAISKMKEWTTALGDAVTQAEALTLKQKELRLSVLENKITTEQATRAEDEFKLKQRETTEAIRERLGIATEQQIFATKQARLDADAAKIGGISPEDRAKATNIQLRELKDAADALTVRQAYLPGLKQLEVDAANVRKGIDTLATQSLNTLADGFADVIIGTKTLADAFKSMTESILRDLVRLSLRQAVFGPLAGLLQSGLGAGFLGSGLASNTALSGASNAGWSAPLSSGGFLPRQGGGSVSGGKGYIVGEHGTELFVPSSSGQIVRVHFSAVVVAAAKSLLTITPQQIWKPNKAKVKDQTASA